MPAVRSVSPNPGPSGPNPASAPAFSATRTRQKYTRFPGKTLRDAFRKAYEDSADPEASSALIIEE
jgi:hypothetical protein